MCHGCCDFSLSPYMYSKISDSPQRLPPVSLLADAFLCASLLPDVELANSAPTKRRETNPRIARNDKYLYARSASTTLVVVVVVVVDAPILSRIVCTCGCCVTTQLSLTLADIGGLSGWPSSEALCVCWAVGRVCWADM